MGAVAAIILGTIAWLSLLGALFVSQDPLLFLALGVVCGVVAIFLAVQARRDAREAAWAAGITGAAAIGAVYGAAVAALLVATVYASGFLVLLALILLLAAMGGWSVSCNAGGSPPPPQEEPCCCEDCCGQCDEGCCTCEACCGCADCGCGDCGCGGCGGCGCGGCGCAALALPPLVGRAAPPVAPLGWRQRFAHHPDLPEFRHDVFHVAGGRFCIGCFVTYPVFLAATLAMLVAPPAMPWHVAALAGLALASAQAVSSAGLARRWWLKVAVKTMLGAGLALYVAGVREAPLPAAVRALGLALALALALLSTIPRTRRMRRARAARRCACHAAPPATPDGVA